MRTHNGTTWLLALCALGLLACESATPSALEPEPEASDDDALSNAVTPSDPVGDLPPELDLTRCSEQGGAALGVRGARINLGDPPQNLSSSDPCPAGRTLLGTIPDEVDDGLCCSVPDSLTLSGCEAEGGHALLDPGGGSTYRDGCEDGRELIGWLSVCETPGLCGEGGICCR